MMATKNKVGRKEIPIDKIQFEKLCSMQCTLEEIASFFDCCDDTINNWCKKTYNDNFSGIYKKKSAGGKIALRRIQFKHAEKNPQMAMFLGKVYLKQRENTPEGNEEKINEVKEFLVKIKEVANDGTSGDK